MTSHSDSLDEEFLELLAWVIEGKTGYKWVPNLTKRGTGSLILVFDTGGFPQYVACKTLLYPDIREPGKLKVFLKEIRRTLRAQGHPLIVRVGFITVVGVPRRDSSGKTYFEKFPLIFMRYYEKNLREYILERGRLDVDEALFIAIQIVKGLLYLKEQGFVTHQDLKPENILLEYICDKFEVKVTPKACIRPRVADFGLANACIEAGILRGPNPYRAPEQFADLTPKSVEKLVEMGLFNPDVFALGAILTEMLTGKHPCGIPSSEVMKEKVAKDTRFWEEWGREGIRIVDVEIPELRDLILRMLNPNPKHRPALENVYRSLMEILRSINPELQATLETWLRYYDEIATSFKEALSDINYQVQLLKLSVFPEARELIEDLADDIKSRLVKVSPPKTPNDVFIHLKLTWALGTVYFYLIKALALESLDVISRWKTQVKAEHVPYLSGLPVTDYEAHAELVDRFIVNLLRLILPDEEIKTLIYEMRDPYIISLYLFGEAGRIRERDFARAMQYLEEALRYTPNNETLLYFKALWKYHQARIERDLTQKCKLLEEAIIELKDLRSRVRKWRELEKSLSEVESEYSEHCSKMPTNPINRNSS
jgi:Protein kinase domain.